MRVSVPARKMQAFIFEGQDLVGQIELGQPGFVGRASREREGARVHDKAVFACAADGAAEATFQLNDGVINAELFQLVAGGQAGESAADDDHIAHVRFPVCGISGMIADIEREM